MKLGSNIDVGGVACDPQGISVALYSLGKFTIGSNDTIRNTYLVTGYDVEPLDLQSHNSYTGVTIQSLGNINLGSNNIFAACPAGTGEGPLGTIAGQVVRLVN